MGVYLDGFTVMLVFFYFFFEMIVCGFRHLIKIKMEYAYLVFGTLKVSSMWELLVVTGSM